MNKIDSWIQSLKDKMKKSGKVRWVFLFIGIVALSAIVVVITIFTIKRGNNYDKDTEKKFKEARKINDRVIKSGRRFLRKRTKYKHKKL
jgi:flagellar basal body-associated protein FliL